MRGALVERINVIMKDPGEPPCVETVDNTPEALQALVGGRLEAIPTPDPTVAVYVNGEGRPDGLEANVGGLAGPILVTGLDPGLGDTVDLTVRQAARYMAMLGGVR